MQTPDTAELSAAIGKTLKSASFARFMTQAVQAAVTELAEQRAAASQDIVLPGMTKPTARLMPSVNGLGITSSDGRCQITLYHGHPDRHPALWWGTEERTDSAGNTWCRCLPYYVMDDFGELVEVPA